MQKVIVTKSGKPCYIAGPGAKNITITAYDAQGNIDEVVEEFEVNGTEAEIESLRTKNNLKDWRRKEIRKVYVRGKDEKVDAIRDRNARASIVRLPAK